MKKKEVGGKTPLSSGKMPAKSVQAKKSAQIKYQTAEFLVSGGSIEHVEFGVMKTDTKGTTALRINQ